MLSLNLSHALSMGLVGVSKETVRNVANIARGSTTPITQVVSVDRTRVVGAEGLVDAVGSVGIAELLEVLFEVVGSGDHHGGDLVLGKAVLAWESGAAITLHEAGSAVAVGIGSGLDTDVAGALL